MNTDTDEPERPRRRTRCVCAPNGDWPGYCPGPDRCPLLADQDPEPEDTDT